MYGFDMGSTTIYFQNYKAQQRFKQLWLVRYFCLAVDGTYCVESRQ